MIRVDATMPAVMLEIDHVVVCVKDLDAARERYRKIGLTSLPGGRHPGHGTLNAIIPLGDAYLELVTVVDASEAESSRFGSWVMERALDPSPDALCLRTDDIEGISERLGLIPQAMSRMRPDGVELSWRLAGIEQAFDDGLAFFIQWDDMALHPGVPNANPEFRLDQVLVRGDEELLRSWVGDVDGVTFAAGASGIEFRVAGS